MACGNHPSETAWQRANKDTLSAFHTLRFWLFDILGVAIFTLLVLLYTPSWVSNEWKIIYQVLVPVFIAVIGLVALYFISLVKAPYKQRNEAREKVRELLVKNVPNISVMPVTGKREDDYDMTEHTMWAELEIKNTTTKELKDVQVHIVKCLTLQEKQDSESHNDFVMWDHRHLNPFCVYWSRRQTEPRQMSLVIPSDATRSVIVAFQENSNGGHFNFNTTYNNFMVGGFKIDVEISSYEAVLWQGDFYIECHPNYVQGERAKFEFVEWNKWAANRNIVLSNFDAG